MTSAAALRLPNNLLSYTDSNFESGVTTWVADVDASGVAATTARALAGTHSLGWTSTVTGTTQVHSGLHPCTAGDPYIASGYIYVPQPGLHLLHRYRVLHDCRRLCL